MISLSDRLRSTNIRVEVTVVPEDTSDSAASSRPPRSQRTVGLGRPIIKNYALNINTTLK